jgi:hypothetical protein
MNGRRSKLRAAQTLSRRHTIDIGFKRVKPEGPPRVRHPTLGKINLVECSRLARLCVGGATQHSTPYPESLAFMRPRFASTMGRVEVRSACC